MGVFCWIFYIFFGIILFFLLELFEKKFNLKRHEKLIFSILYMVFLSEFCFYYTLNYTKDIFLIYVFTMICNIFFDYYVIDKDFFDKCEKNILYYIVLFVFGFIVNQYFINKVSSVFLVGSEFKIVFWLLIILYLYNFTNRNNLFKKENVSNDKCMSVKAILNNYAKLKYLYYDDCDCDNREISNILYAIMIYENNKRNKFFRRIDNFMYKVNNKKCKLGIMQVESKKFITDSESIDIVKEKINKIYVNKKRKAISFVFDEYYGFDNFDVKYIFDIIKKF